MTTISLSLPYPPSSNSLWRAVNGRNISSKPYRYWQLAAAAEVTRQSPGTITGPYRITYQAQRPDRRARDVENLPKALSDLLQSSGVIRNDCDCQSSTVEWASDPPAKGARVFIWITPVGVET